MATVTTIYTDYDYDARKMNEICKMDSHLYSEVIAAYVKKIKGSGSGRGKDEIADDFNVDENKMADIENYVKQTAFEQINLELARKGRQPMTRNTAPTDESTRIQALGAVGEKLVRWYLTTVDKIKIIEAFDPMDKEKDFSFENGETAEIKTQSPYYNLNAFAVRDNQLNKLRKVDHIYFVETPRRKEISSGRWTFSVRGEFAGGDWLGKKAGDYESRVYILHKKDNDIRNIIEELKVYAKDGSSRNMLLIPIKKLEVAFTITLDKHLILLDKYSTNPIGLLE